MRISILGKTSAAAAAALALSCSGGAELGESTGESTSALNTVLVDAANYSDAAGWLAPQYGSTVKFLDMNNDGRADVCGRGSAGIWCAIDDGTGHLANDAIWSTEYSDARGWSAHSQYSTIAYPDLNNDSRPDVCGRSANGLVCALSNGAGFGPASLWSTNYRDVDNWDQIRYYSTIQFADLNVDGKVDVCGRGTFGIWCALSTGTTFGTSTRWTPSFNDNDGWSADEYGSTIKLADINGDGAADICGRSAGGIYCARSRGTSFDSLQRWSREFTDATHWNDPTYYQSLRFVDVNKDGLKDVCGRGINGVQCATSTGAAFNTPTIWDAAFSDASGWAFPEYYSTIRISDGVLCGRGAGGMLCSFAEQGHAKFGNLTLVSTNESNAGGWNQPQYYSSIALTRDLKIAERGSPGIFSTNAAQGILPNAPSNLTAMAVSDKAIALMWRDNSSDEGQFTCTARETAALCSIAGRLVAALRPT